MRQKNAQLAGIQTGVAADAEAGHLVFVVTDENKWCPSQQLLSVHRDAEIEKSEVT